MGPGHPQELSTTVVVVVPLGKGQVVAVLWGRWFSLREGAGRGEGEGELTRCR